MGRDRLIQGGGYLFQESWVSSLELETEHTGMFLDKGQLAQNGDIRLLLQSV